MNLVSRRRLLRTISSIGIAAPVFGRALISQSDDSSELTVEQIKHAEWISGIELSADQREQLLDETNRNNKMNLKLREQEISHSVPPALHFQTLATTPRIGAPVRNATTIEANVIELPKSDEEIAYLPVNQLSWLIRTQKISSTKLTKIYLDRLKKYSGMLRCVVTLTEALAAKQAARADEELATGTYRGPLHGIPWGAKDLIEVPGYPTTWGIPYYKDRKLGTTATVAKRLEDAGAVLVAKLSLGALAMGDKWFGGMTRNPWNPKIGSSGSSAGSVSATVAGLVGFSLGSETLGSILTPSSRCGATGLRPTFGRISRAGCMPLSWSMDKIGPICRSVEDCALIFDAIHGKDGLDQTADNYQFNWPSAISIQGLRVGYRKNDTPVDERADLVPLKNMGCELIEMELKTDIPLFALTSIISVEGASVFDQMIRDGHTEGWNTWPETFLAANQISAVDYVRYQRARTKLMHEFEEQIADVDVLVNMRDLVYTNFTGHPSIIFPAAVNIVGESQYKPTPIVITGHLNQDEKLLALAAAYQSTQPAIEFRPPLDYWLKKFDEGELVDAKQ